MAALFGVETCNARTRSGGLCQNAPIYPAGRCRMHGGKSLRGLPARASNMVATAKTC